MAGFSAQNSGNRPFTRQVGGGNGFSDAFEENNPDYIHKGERPDYYNARGGPDSIDARAGASMPGTGPGTGNTSIPMGRGFSGLDYYHALQNRNLPAFRQPNQGTPWGMGNSAQEIGANIHQSGNMLRADGTYVPDTMYNRTLGSMNPYGGGGNQAPQQEPQAPNEDQQRWAQKFAESQRQPMAPENTPADNSLGGAMNGSGLSMPPSLGKAPPLNFSRSALIEGAKKSGELADIIKDYNAKGAASGHVMDERGNISYKPEVFRQNTLQPQADEIRARRDFATGNSPATFSNPMLNPNADEMNPQPIMGSKFGRYGSGSSLIGSANTPKVTSGGTMPNPITGQAIKMNPYLKEQSDVGETKYGDRTTGKSVASAMKSAKPLDAAKGQYFRNKVRGIA